MEDLRVAYPIHMPLIVEDMRPVLSCPDRESSLSPHVNVVAPDILLSLYPASSPPFIPR